METIVNKPAESANPTSPAMQTANHNPPADMDMISAMRLPQNYGATLGVKKLLTKVPVDKHPNTSFFRTHPDPTMTMALLLFKHGKDGYYAVAPNMGPVLGKLARPTALYLTVDRQGNPYLVPVPLPAEDGTRNSWHVSLHQALEVAKTQWVRLQSSESLPAYDVHVAQGALSEPEWPTASMDELVKIAFQGRFIQSPDHAVIQAILGQI